MNLRTLSCITLGLVVGLADPALAQNNPPVVSNVTAAQRPGASKLVDIHYNLADADGDACSVWVAVSDNGGTSFQAAAWSFTGAIGNGITPGTNKTIVWDAGADMPGRVGSNFKVRVWADDGNGPAPMVVVPAGWFPYQNTTSPGAWVFVPTFLIDKYEVTNTRYCEFLNNADPNGTYWDANQEITRSGSAGNYSYTVQPGKNSYPIRYVNYNDATAFAAWRSSQTGRTYRLPNQFEWEKAAAWDPVQNRYYLYGFHADTISCPWANYNNCIGAPMPVGSYNGTGGRQDAKSYYGCYDMSGNVWEWTSELSGSERVIRGGAWSTNASNCLCTTRGYNSPSSRGNNVGFRLVLDSN
jgi:sulfatase modifying factor 1